MIEARPKRLFSWDYRLFEAGRPLTTLVTNTMRERARFELEGESYEIRRESGWGAFVLTSATGEVCRAVKPSAFIRRFELTYEGVSYDWHAPSMLGRGFVLEDEQREVGTLAAEGLFSRAYVVDLPSTLPAAVRVFLVWLAVITHRRRARSS